MLVFQFLRQSLHESFCEPMPGWPKPGIQFLMSGFGLSCKFHLCMTRDV